MLALALIAVVATAGVALWLRRPGEGETVAGIARRLKDGAATHRREAATALGQVAGPGAAEAARALIAGLDDADADVRARACRALGTLLAANRLTTLDDEAARVLTSALGDPRPAVRASAAIALRGLDRDPPRSLDGLLDGLRGDDPALRVAAETALAGRPIRIGDDLRRLLDGLDDENLAARRALRASLLRPHRELPPGVALPVLGATIRGGSATAREVAATALGRSLGRASRPRATCSWPRWPGTPIHPSARPPRRPWGRSPRIDWRGSHYGRRPTTRTSASAPRPRRAGPPAVARPRAEADRRAPDGPGS